MLALYAADLANNNTILCRAIKSNTIKQYLRAAASFSIAAQRLDPQLDIYGKRSFWINKVLQEVKRWESMPDRREPVTVEMIEYMLTHKTSDVDGLYNALTDWNIVGQYVGQRLGEWALTNYAKSVPMTNKGKPIPFCFEDIVFVGIQNKRLRQSRSTKLLISEVTAVYVHWKVQKNGDNGQKVLFTKNKANVKLCPVRAFLRIRERARRCRLSSSVPLAVFVKDGEVHYIRAKHIEEHLRGVAQVVYDVSDSDDLRRWSAHSIRVGAAVRLHTAGKDGPYIQLRLRWRSTTFLVYLRNTIEIADQQHVN